MAEFNAYLRFNGKTREAMAFYRDCFGGELSMMTVGESPMISMTPPEMHDKIMHSMLTSDSIMIMGSDLTGDKEYTHGTAMALCLVCKSKDEIETLFAKLSAGGQVTTPLGEMFFGTYGDLVDKYGFSWILQYGDGQKVE